MSPSDLPLGIYLGTDPYSATEMVAAAQRFEALGYRELWLPETLSRDPFVHAAHLAAATTSLRFGTGIANIHNRHAGAAKQAAVTVDEQSGGRFTLGLGVSHAPLVSRVRGLDWSKPVATMRDYLSAYASSPIQGRHLRDRSVPVVIAALGPRMLDLGAELADGVHPYFTTPEHTADARARIGPGKLLIVEQKVVLTDDPAVGRAAAAGAIDLYAAFPNYRRSWHRLGFDDDAIDARAPRLLDALVAHGPADRITERLVEHRAAGADLVLVHVLHPEHGIKAFDWAATEALAPRAHVRRGTE